MKLPNWFRVSWWIILLVLLSCFLYTRYPSLRDGAHSSFDLIAFIIWIALVLVPIFQEIGLFGVKLKHEFESFKRHVSDEMLSIRNDIRQSLSIRSQINPQFSIFSLQRPHPDTELQTIRQNVEPLLQDIQVFGENAISKVAESGDSILIPSGDIPIKEFENLLLFRSFIESELRRIAYAFLPIAGSIPEGYPLVGDLVTEGTIKPELGRAIREVHSIISYVTREGGEITIEELRFVKNLAPKLIETLRRIK